MTQRLWRPRVGRRALAVLGVVGLLAVPVGLLRHNPIAVAHADDATVFIVNGIPESLGEWKTALTLAQNVSQTGTSVTQGVNPAGVSVATLHAQVFAAMKEGFAALAAAKQQGLSVSDQEVGTLVAQQQQLEAASPDGTALVQQMAQAIGMSTDQFWVYARPYYARALVIARLRTQYEDSLGTMSAAEKAAMWQNHLQDLVKAATVEIINPTAVQ